MFSYSWTLNKQFKMRSFSARHHGGSLRGGLHDGDLHPRHRVRRDLERVDEDAPLLELPAIRARGHRERDLREPREPRVHRHLLPVLGPEDIPEAHGHGGHLLLRTIARPDRLHARVQDRRLRHSENEAGHGLQGALPEPGGQDELQELKLVVLLSPSLFMYLISFRWVRTLSRFAQSVRSSHFA